MLFKKPATEIWKNKQPFYVPRTLKPFASFTKSIANQTDIVLFLNILFEYSNDLPGEDLRMKLKSTVVRKHKVGTEDNLKDSVVCFQKHSRYELSSNNARCFISDWSKSRFN